MAVYQEYLSISGLHKLHGGNRARNVHANSVMRKRKFVHVIDFFV